MKAHIKAKKTKKQHPLLAEAIVETEEANRSVPFTTTFKRQLMDVINQKHRYVGGGALVIGSFVASILNYIFNAYLGRVLSFDDFALIGLMGGFISIASIIFGAYIFTVNYSCSFLIGKYGDASAYRFWKYMQKRSFIPSVILAAIWLVITPLLMNFFHTDNTYLFLLFSVVLLVGFISSINQGFLAAKLMFGSLAVLSLVDPVVKLAVMFQLASVGLQQWAFAAMATSFFAVFITSWVLIKKQVRNETSSILPIEKQHFSNKFFSLSVLTGFSSVAYFTFDIFLAKHFLPPDQAGQYVLVSLVGKMIFFLGNLTAPFITPIISRYEGAQKNSLHALYVLIGATTLFTLIGFLLFGILGYFTVPLLYGKKALTIVPYVLPFTFGMACYTVSGVFVNYYLVRKIYSFTIVMALLVLVQIGFISLFHDSVQSIAMVMSFVLTANLVATLIMHMRAKQVKTIEKSLAVSVRGYFKNRKNGQANYLVAAVDSIQKILLKGTK